MNASDKDLRTALPSEKAEKQKEVEAALQKSKNLQQEMMREDFGRTFQTEHGKRVLAWLAQRCGWGKPPLAAVDGVIHEKHTTHNAMELSLYIAVRQNVPVEVLQQVEYGQVKPSGTVDEDALKRQTSKTKSKGK